MDNFSLKYLFFGDGTAKDWWKALGAGWRLAVLGIGVIVLLTGVRSVIGWFIKPQQNVNKPTVVVTPFSKVDTIDQTSTQINVEPEKTWECGIFGAGLRYDNKDGILVGGIFKKRW